MELPRRCQNGGESDEGIRTEERTFARPAIASLIQARRSMTLPPISQPWPCFAG